MSALNSLVKGLHEKLLHITELENQIARCPRLIQNADQMVVAANRDLEICRETIKQRRKDVDGKQLQQREREDKLKNLEGKMHSSKNNREFQTLKEQIAADSQANSVLSDEIFEILEEIDALQANTVTLADKIKFAEAEREKVHASIDKRLVDLKVELEKAKESLLGMEQQLSPEMKTDYRRLVDTRGADGLSEIDAQSCGGCYFKVTPRVIDRLRMGQPCLCSSCGRLLYNAAD